MKAIIVKPPRGGSIAAIASKSYAHRALIAAALSDTQTEIACAEQNEDIHSTVRCLQALGAYISYTDGVFTVQPLMRPVDRDDDHILDCGESGSTLRFLLPVACALGANASFAMHGRLPQRPLSPLYEELAAHGCCLSPQRTTPLNISGTLTGGAFTIAGNVSSQFITGLLFALPLLRGDSRIGVTGTLESRPYVDLTLQTLTDFGIVIAEDEGSFLIRGGQQYRSPGALTVEGDWSNAANWLALGAITAQPATVIGLNANSPQGDKAFVNILRRFGARIAVDDSAVTAAGGSLRGIDVDASENPDLVPFIAAVALAAEGRTRILNAARLRLKECDRLRVIADTMRSFGADISETPDGLIIEGGRKLHGGSVSSSNDHRIVMMAAVVSALCKGEVVINHAEAVNKSYPRFFDDVRTLGGEVREESA